MRVRIRPFQPEDQAQAKALILSGLVEHWGFLDPRLNPDLEDIQSSYQYGTFLIAEVEGQIVGTGALVPISAETAEIKRMSVAPDVRRAGIGRMILRVLRDTAKQQGFRRLVLETTATWAGVIEFYGRFGFRISHIENGDAYFSLSLEDTEV